MKILSLIQQSENSEQMILLISAERNFSADILTSIGREKIWTRNVFLLSARWLPPPRLGHNPLLRHIGSQLDTPSSKLGLALASTETLCANTFRAWFQLLFAFVACILHIAHWVKKLGLGPASAGTLCANILALCVQMH